MSGNLNTYVAGPASRSRNCNLCHDFRQSEGVSGNLNICAVIRQEQRSEEAPAFSTRLHGIRHSGSSPAELNLGKRGTSVINFGCAGPRANAILLRRARNSTATTSPGPRGKRALPNEGLSRIMMTGYAQGANSK